MSTQINITKDGQGNITATDKAEVQTQTAPAESSGLRSRVNPGVSRVAISGGTVTTSGAQVVRTTTAGIVADKVADAPGDILATARAKSGRPLARHEVTSDSLVNVGGMQLEVGDAVRHGWIHLSELGHHYSTVSGAEAAAMAEEEAHQATEGDVEEPYEALSGRTLQFMKAGTQSLHENAAGSHLLNALTGEFEESVFRREVEANNGNAEAELALFYAASDAIAGDLGEQIGLAAYAEENGMDTSEAMNGLIDELDESDRGRLQDALRQLIVVGTAEPLIHLLDKAHRLSTVDAEALSDEGHELRKSADGETLVNVGGTWTKLSVARRIGAI